MASAIFRMTELCTHTKHLHYYVRHITETHISCLMLPHVYKRVAQYMLSIWHTLMSFSLQEQSRKVKTAGSETVMPLLHYVVFTFGKFFVYTYIQ